jgi:P4 family phage/plasmid primase-like protien
MSAVVQLAPTATLFDELHDRRMFIVARTDTKAPVNPHTLLNSNAQDATTWFTPAEAQAHAARLGAGFGVGIVLTGGCGLACIDIDGGWNGTEWSALSITLLTLFAGAYVELSISGRGLHIIFAYTGEFPAHACKNVGLHIELYHEGRYILLTGTHARGSVLKDCSDLALGVAYQYFPPSLESAATGTDWTTEPTWHVPGTSDDAELVAKACRSKSAAAIFGDGVTFEALWTADADALAKCWPGNATQATPYDASSADQSLANRLMWWTGGDCERTERLMRASALAPGREHKWDRLLRGTILNAREYVAKNPPKSMLVLPPLASVPAGTAPPPPDADPYVSRVDRTDAGNANLLVLLAKGNLRYVAETKQWLRWDGKRWQVDEHEVFVTTFALEVAKYYLDESKRLFVLAKEPGRGDAHVAAEEAAKWAAKCRNKGSIDNMITLARKSEGVPISVVELDRKPHLLGVENGVVDLRTGELHEAEGREDYVTKRCPVRYIQTATAPRWEALIAQATGSPIPADRDASGAVVPGTVGRFTPRPELAHYMHKALGYGATGETREQKFFFGIGEGSNGKGLIFDTVKSVLGPYAVALPSDALMAAKHGADAERPTALAATLAGARFVIASESKEGQKLDVAMIKAHTGDSEMTARRMRENPFTFAITHKIWLLTNVRPAIDHLDPAIKGRLHLVPFDRRWNRPGEFERDPALPDGDKGLMAQLAAEAEGVLASIVRGAVLYARDGLTPPAEVVEKTREYVMEQDHLGRWLATMQRCAPKQGTPAAELFNRFTQWCQADGCAFEPNTMTAFGRALRSRRIEMMHDRSGNHWGLRLALAPPPPAT